MTISSDNDRLTIIIPKLLKTKIKGLADAENRSISNYVVKVLDEHVAQCMEDYMAKEIREIRHRELKVSEKINPYMDNNLDEY